MSAAPTAPGSARQLTLVDCLGIGVNGIVGTGIFLLPASVYAASGGLSWAAWFAVGGLCLLIGLCFAEVASMTDRSGGPYAYARDAFGESFGFAVGWMALATTLLGYSAVARGFGQNLSYLLPVFSQDWAQVVLAFGIILSLGALNWFGVKLGAWTSDLFSVAKLVPLLLFVGVGLFFVNWGKLSAPPPGGAVPAWEALRLGGLAGLFACTGFEYIPVPAGETANPRRAVPLALVGSLFGATLLYALVQVVVVGTHPALAGSEKPLAESAAVFGGGWAGRAVTVGALISAFGFCTGSALVGPRYLAAFADDGILPRFLGWRHARHLTPTVAIVVVAGLSALLAGFLDFRRLADLNNAAVFAQYLPTCLAVLVLRVKKPDAPRPFRLPLGPVIPVLAIAGSLLFIWGTHSRDLYFALWVLLGGLVLFAAAKLLRRGRAVPAMPPQP
jgi:amino acid transporter